MLDSGYFDIALDDWFLTLFVSNKKVLGPDFLWPTPLLLLVFCKPYLAHFPLSQFLLGPSPDAVPVIMLILTGYAFDASSCWRSRFEGPSTRSGSTLCPSISIPHIGQVITLITASLQL
jgi:hypothetical protein